MIPEIIHNPDVVVHLKFDHPNMGELVDPSEAIIGTISLLIYFGDELSVKVIPVEIPWDIPKGTILRPNALRPEKPIIETPRRIAARVAFGVVLGLLTFFLMILFYLEICRVGGCPL